MIPKLAVLKLTAEFQLIHIQIVSLLTNLCYNAGICASGGSFKTFEN